VFTPTKLQAPHILCVQPRLKVLTSTLAFFDDICSVYLIVAKLDGEFLYIGLCLVALRHPCPLVLASPCALLANTHSAAIAVNTTSLVLTDSPYLAHHGCKGECAALLPVPTPPSARQLHLEIFRTPSVAMGYLHLNLTPTSTDNHLCSHNALCGLSAYATRT
jgi:hypothetical protein